MQELTRFEGDSRCHFEVTPKYLTPQVLISGNPIPSLAALSSSHDILVRQLRQDGQQHWLRNQRPSRQIVFSFALVVVERTIQEDDLFRHIFQTTRTRTDFKVLIEIECTMIDDNSHSQAEPTV